MTKHEGKFNKGDRVRWNSSSGMVEGTIEDIITKPTNFRNHHFEASDEDPRYLVKSAKTGKEAIHQRDALEKI
jgi:hypothetical protein